MSYVLAVDGGNTKTIALVASLDGTILGAGRGGCGDIYNSGADGKGSPTLALANIEYAVTSALQNANLTSAELAVSVFNLAGADWPEDFAFLHAEMKARGFGQAIQVQNDALGILHAGAADNIGVSVICGTGSAIGARGPDGRIWHSSFWQMGTEGSWQMSAKTWHAVLHAELGILPPTSLRARVLAMFEVETIEEILYFMTSREMHEQRPRFADRLTPILLDEAAAGDSVAQQVVREHGYALGRYGQAAARRVGIEGTAFKLVLAGGVLHHPCTLLADAIAEQVHTTSPEARPLRSPFEPVIGALFSALEASGAALDEKVMAKLKASIPDPSLFETIPPHFF